jgi:hypothetical protein
VLHNHLSFSGPIERQESSPSPSSITTPDTAPAEGLLEGQPAALEHSFVNFGDDGQWAWGAAPVQVSDGPLVVGNGVPPPHGTETAQLDPIEQQAQPPPAMSNVQWVSQPLVVNEQLPQQPIEVAAQPVRPLS